MRSQSPPWGFFCFCFCICFFLAVHFFPVRARRYCNSSHKESQINPLIQPLTFPAFFSNQTIWTPRWPPAPAGIIIAGWSNVNSGRALLYNCRVMMRWPAAGVLVEPWSRSGRSGCPGRGGGGEVMGGRRCPGCDFWRVEKLRSDLKNVQNWNSNWNTRWKCWGTADKQWLEEKKRWMKKNKWNEMNDSSTWWSPPLNPLLLLDMFDILLEYLVT